MCIRDSKVIADMEMPAESVEVRFPILAANFAAYGDQIIEDLRDLVASGQLEGATLVTPNYEGCLLYTSRCV